MVFFEICRHKWRRLGGFGILQCEKCMEIKKEDKAVRDLKRMFGMKK